MKKTVMPLLVASAFLLLGAGTASGAASGYCGTSVGPDTWCASGIWANITYNLAEERSSAVVRVGIRQVLSSGGIINRKFGYDRVATNSGSQWSTPQVANGSGATRTIYGYTEYWCCNSSLSAATSASTSVSSSASTATDASYTVESSGKAKCLTRRTTSDVTQSCSAATDVSGVPVLVTEDMTTDLPAGTTRIYGVAPKGSSYVMVALGANIPVRTAVAANGVFVSEQRGDASSKVSVSPTK